ncbi:hypothetical protein ANANG_G00227680 [Anguilla anguilla]|uniref:SUZ domain-containing protein n=1 Tax=Anguilla anguilla TaxID=7936 RepID=A0A9D3LXG2_ANGAN|nr:hypothetical protein ANANG_G00227680 [Anguilla anguilla]
MEDEEVTENWEEAADSGEMERRLEEKLRISQKEKMSNAGSGRSPLRTPIVIQDDSLPAAPPPQIRILKRPSSNGSLGSPAAAMRPSRSATPDDSPQDRPNADRPARVSGPPPSEEPRSTNHVVRQPAGPDVGC